jgi:DNA polymerase I-like protein with 3'-5' exonuclease and polymerase domains
MFDLLFLAAYHGVPFGRRNWDTMLVHHRLHLETEKSLAHVIRYYINAPYHKGDFSSYTPYNYRQQEELLLYNAKDVQTLREVHKVQLGILNNDVRTRVTIQQANDLVYLYSLMSLQGIGVDMVRVKAIRDHNDEVLVQLRRVLRLLVGHDINPSSPDQLVEYFHTRLGYKPVERTAQGAPSLEADCLYKLLIETGNPVIKVVLLARKIAKQNGMLKFKWMALKRKRVA